MMISPLFSDKFMGSSAATAKPQHTLTTRILSYKVEREKQYHLIRIVQSCVRKGHCWNTYNIEAEKMLSDKFRAWAPSDTRESQANT